MRRAFKAQSDRRTAIVGNGLGLCLIIISICIPASGLAAGTGQEQPDLTKLLQESQFLLPRHTDLRVKAIAADPVLPYQWRARTRNHELEVRVALRPLDRLHIEYDDPHGGAPQPNHLFPLMFQKLLELMSRNASSIDRVYPRQQAKEKFKADWAGAGIFDVSSNMNTDYQQGFLLALHKNDVADVYVLLLFDHAKKIKAQLQRILNELNFYPDS